MGDKWIDNYLEFCKNQWNNFEYKITDGESLAEVQKRSIKELENILNINNGKTIIIGIHATILSTIINYYDKTYNYQNFLIIENKMPYIIKLEFNDREYIRREEVLL